MFLFVEFLHVPGNMNKMFAGAVKAYNASGRVYKRTRGEVLNK